MTTPRGWPERRAGTCSDGDALDLRHPDARRTGRQKDRSNNMHSVPPIPERTTRTAQIAEYLQTRQRHEGRIARGYGAPLNR